MANTYNTDLSNNNASLQAILNSINNLPESEDVVLQSKTVTPSTTAQTVTPDSGYNGLSSVVVNAMTTTDIESPSISVSSTGVITATTTQTQGYVEAGSASNTYSLSTQGAKTITPSTSNQTAVSSGKYTTGTITVAGDSDLIASNIKSGVSIFGVTGTYTGTAPQIFESSNQSDFSAAGSGGIVLFKIPTSIADKTIHYISFSFQADHVRLGTANYSIYWPYQGNTSKVGVGSASCTASMSSNKTLSFDITNANSNFDSDNFYFDYGVIIYS